MSYLLNIIYATVLLLATPWLLWRYLRYGKNRRGWSQKLFGFVPRRKSDQGCFWFHAVSVGEVNLLAPVIECIHQQRPDIEIVISTTTETGYDLANQKYLGQSGCVSVFFFPFDFTWAIKNVLRRIRPDLIVFAELEIWPNFLRVASGNSTSPTRERVSPTPSPATNEQAAEVSRRLLHKSVTALPITSSPDHPAFPAPNRPNPMLAVINGRLSDASFRGYQKWKWLLASSFARLHFVAAQNQTYADRFLAMGCDPEKVIVTGSVKFDGVQTDRQNSKSISLARLAGIKAEIKPQEIVLLAGSTQFEEDIIAAEVYQQLASEFPQLRLILAPRHPDRVPQLVRALEQMGLPVTRRSTINADESESPHLPIPPSPHHPTSHHPTSHHPTSRPPHPILIVDVIGELSAWWGVADMAYVGGSLGSRGGQNMIEPAAYGIPVSFGPNTQNFREVVANLLAADAATVVGDRQQWSQFVRRVLTEPDWATDIGSRAQAEILRHHGASDRTVGGLLGLLEGGIDVCSKKLLV